MGRFSLKATLVLTVLTVFIVSIGFVPYAKAGVVADAGPPLYLVAKGGEVTLIGENSENAQTYSWSIIDDPTGEVYLTNDSQENAIFHAPQDIDEDVTVTVRLLVTDNGNSDDDNTEVRVLDLLIARHGGPYQVYENNTVELDAGMSSGYIETYSWSIIDDPTDNSHLTGDSQKVATFHAPPDVSKNEEVRIRLTVIDGENNAQDNETIVTVIDPLVCDPDGPYPVFESTGIELDGKGSNGYDGGDIIDWNWSIIDDPTGEAYLTNADTSTPTFHAPSNVSADKAVDIKLLVTDEGGNSKEETTTVTVKDNLVADAGPDKVITEDKTITLDAGNSSGYIETYIWSIIDDPTDNSYLTGDSQKVATFHAPPKVDDDKDIIVELTVSSKWNEYWFTDNNLVKITVRPEQPNPPLNLAVSSVVDPVPSFSSKFDDNNPEAIATKAQIQIGTSQGGKDVWDYTKSGLSLVVGSEEEIPYGGDPLSPEGVYYWRMRFYDNARWGDWSSDTFTMGKLENIIVSGVGFGHTAGARDIMLYGVGPSKAASGLSKAYEIDPSSSAKVLENAWLYNPAGTLDIFYQMDAEDRAKFLVQISKLPSTTDEAASILDDMDIDDAGETVEAMIDLGEYGAINSIFGSLYLSEVNLNKIVKGLSEELKSKLKDHLSAEVEDRISPGLLPDETNWVLIAGILAAAGVAAAVVLARYEQIFGRFFERPPKPARMVPGGREWLGLMRDFLKSGKRKMAIKTDLPSSQALKLSRAVIRKSGRQDIIGVERVGDRVYLLRKAKPGAEWTKLVQGFLESGKNQKLVKTDQPPKRTKRLLQAAIQGLGKEDMVRAIEEEGIVYLARL